MKKFLGRLGSLWFACVLGGYYLIFFPLYFFLLIQPTPKRRRMAHQLNRLWGKVLLTLTGVRIQKHDPYTPPSPCIIVANHRSYIDIPICYVSFPPQVAFIGKAELAQIPLYGWMYKRLHITVNRKNPEDRKKSLLRAHKMLEEGFCILFYPEGTTKHEKPLGKFYDGAFTLAKESGLPIVPITIAGSDALLSADGKFYMWPGKAHVFFHPPIFPNEYSVENLKEIVRQWMYQTLTTYENRRAFASTAM
ncbi:MAG: lysophospholipid acyltransferase family protein [Bacteroidia bacterium]